MNLEENIIAVTGASPKEDNQGLLQPLKGGDGKENPINPPKDRPQVKREPFPDASEVICFFETHQAPQAPIRLDRCTIVTDSNLFISAELDILRAQNGNATFTPDIERLKLLMQKMN